ncbi:hypothetical protein O3M35_007711 [Rhynocoris fuscipes]|uniref:Odorant receptor n=1 Tax=Rhynocoris fuscipes TaxID=488301 RepID=A0AAW1DDZ1_9HEMI
MVFNRKPWIFLYIGCHWIIVNSFGLSSVNITDSESRTVIGLFIGSRSVEDLSGFLSSLAVYLMTFPKMVTFILKEKEIRDLLERLENIRSEMLKDEKNREYVVKAGNTSRKLVTVLILYGLSGPLLGFIKQTISDYMTDFNDKRFYVQVWYPWSIDEVWAYLGTNLWVTLSIESSIIGSTCFTIFHVTFALQMSSYLKILQKYFETKGPANKEIYEQHKVILKLIEDYNEIFCRQMIIETLAAPVLPCGIGLVFIRDLRRNGFRNFDAIQKLTCCFLNTLTLCCGGQEIITQVERLHEASYMSKWYEEKPKVRKNLLMLMTRTLKTTSIHYRQFIKFDHECMAKIPEHISPFKIVYYNYKYSGFMVIDRKPLAVLYTTCHWVIVNSFGLSSVVGLLIGSRSVEDITGFLSSLAVYLMTFPKMVTYVLKGKEIRDLLERLENFRSEMLKDEENKDYILKAGNTSRKLVTALILYGLSGPPLGFIKQTISDYMTDFNDKRFYVHVWFPWSIDEVWPYLGTNLWVTLSIESSILGNFGFTIFHITFALQMSAYLKILQKYFETKGPANKEIYEQHKVILKLIEDYNEIFCGQMIIETLAAPILPCGIGLIFIRDLRRNGFRNFDAIQKLTCCFLNTLILCCGGQEIITQVERLHEASYMSKWYEEKPEVRKDQLILMTRTLKTNSIHYRQFFKFDHERMANVNSIF